VAPDPVTNKQLTVALAKKMRGKFYVPIHVPSFVLKIVLGEMSIEVLKSARVSCNKIKTAGFAFTYPAVDDALKQLIGQ
jgi:NAD dependent epimerase/dehydratase family enzyme